MTNTALKPMHPGELLREDVIPATQASKSDIAAMLGISRQTLYQVLNEEQQVTANLALRLARLFGGTAESWLNLQAQYDLALEGERLREDLEQIKPLEVA